MIIMLSEKYNKNILEACASKNPLKDLSDYVSRVEITKDINNEQLLENANRVIRILKDSQGSEIKEQYLVENSEKELYNAVKNVVESSNYKEYLKELENLNPIVTKFFDEVLVMDKDENIKNNRIALLSLLKKRYNHLTDFSKI